MDRLDQEVYVKLTAEQRRRLEAVAAIYSRSLTSVGREAIVRFLHEHADDVTPATPRG